MSLNSSSWSFASLNVPRSKVCSDMEVLLRRDYSRVLWEVHIFFASYRILTDSRVSQRGCISTVVRTHYV